MVLQIDQKSYPDNSDAKLFSVLAESIKQPLVAISRTAELVSHRQDSDIDKVGFMADSTIRLIDHYLLSIRLKCMDQSSLMEPVSLSAALTDVAHSLSDQARRSRCDLEIHIAGKYEPVMANHKGLLAAFQELGVLLLSAQEQRDHVTRPLIKLSAYKTRHGIVSGVFSNNVSISTDLLRRARLLQGFATLPIGQLSGSAGAGLFVADSLLQDISGGLRVAKYRKTRGMAATFAPNRQLVLV